jgi:hypothetical protein
MAEFVETLQESLRQRTSILVLFCSPVGAFELARAAPEFSGARSVESCVSNFQ